MSYPKRGEIYYFSLGDLKEVGSEQRGGRPGIIVSNNSNNLHSECVEVVLLTTKQKKSLPTHVEVNTSKFPSIALCEQVKTYSKQRLGEYLGVITSEEWLAINDALSISLDLPPVIGADRTKEVDDLKAHVECLTKALRDTESMLLTAHTEVEDLTNELNVYKLDKTETNVKTQKYKTERDVYKTMYEQLLERVISCYKMEE